ncbi:MAG: putative N-acetylmannosamine-6-phosphate 2-epimerase [Ignavibacteriae bacterium]|nr:putative N-acetylmannosamine-6-phosphate 2-epimerase [Ignavibacteriota bacterium]MCB9217340.1 putative N-acetylmannosamine-6-phosphate 2-epimerase [Ignavibacteria bacterium]
MSRTIEGMIHRGVVVSCQLDPNEPLHWPSHCALFAQSAMLGGAVGIRAEGLDNIKEIRATVRLPIIGCIRGNYDDDLPLVTPDMAAVDNLYRVGVDVIAIDATSRQRPGTIIDGTRFLGDMRKRYPAHLLLADISSVEEGIKAVEAGADALSTVLFGRTPETMELAASPEDHLELLHKLASAINQPVFAEGFIWNTADAEAALNAGAYGVIVGGAITRPRVLTQIFAETVESVLM